MTCCCTFITCYLTGLSFTEIRTTEELGKGPGRWNVNPGAPASKPRLLYLEMSLLFLLAFECPWHLL